MTTHEASLERQFIEHLRHHLSGWRAKIVADFSKDSYDAELAALSRDSVYPKFHLNSPEYVIIRFMGRVSISIGRRLGEIYDKVPRLLASVRYNLLPHQVAPRFNGLELDIGLRFEQLSNQDQQHVRNVCASYFNGALDQGGIGIEIRYNFNPNDSSRLRKDEAMAEKLVQNHLTPIYLIFSSISPRDEAIARLRRAGWTFIIGQQGLDFATELLGMNLSSILDRPAVSAEIKSEIDGMMSDIKSSFAFSQFN